MKNNLNFYCNFLMVYWANTNDADILEFNTYDIGEINGNEMQELKDLVEKMNIA
jgi:hypothetical protein